LSSITSDLTIDNSGTGIFTQDNGTTIKNVEYFSELTTGFGNDTIAFTDQFNERVYTGDGDDTIALGVGNNDYADGGEGDDLLIIDYSSNTFTGSTNYTAGISSETYWWNPSSGYFRAFYDSNGNSDFISFDGIERLSITGTGSNDAIQTSNGDDLITGVNPNSTTPGQGEVDTLTGGLGSDRFILGDFNWVGYDDSNASSAGSTDYALITDFTVDDVIQLNGASGNYNLTISGSDTHLYLDKPGAEPDELIAVLQNISTTWHQNPTNNHFYKIIEVGSWQDAENAAIAENAHLVSINDQSEQEWLIQTFGTGEYYWIGLTDQKTEGLWEWTSGEPLTYTNWSQGEPNNNNFLSSENYAHLNWGSDGSWNDIGIDSPEWSSVRKAIIESNEVQQPDLSLTESYFSYVSNLPTVTVNLSPTSVNEDGTANLVYTFTRTGSTANSLTVSYDIIGTALSSDYTGATPGTGKTITFAAGFSTATLTIDPTADRIIEGNESVIITLAPSTNNYDVGSEKAARGIILDDETTTISLTVSSSSVTEDGTTNLEYTFTRIGATTNALTVNYSIAGTADSSDYTGATPGTGKTITFAAGSNTATLTIAPTADTTVEPDETVVLTLTDGTGYTIETTESVTGTIANDDVVSATGTVLRGTPQNDSLDASTGQYTVIPYEGDDTIVVNTASDVIIELPGQGTDTIESSVNYNLAAQTHLENLTLTGTDDITGIGNRRDNVITGNSGQNVLVGLQGDDTFVFNFGESTIAKPDRIRDFGIGDDRIQIGDQLILTQQSLNELPSKTDSNVATLSNLVNSVFADTNSTLSGNQALGVNSAALGTYTSLGITNTYLIVNDGIDGFNAETDLIINIARTESDRFGGRVINEIGL
jgi:Ca2+-binding RTX toxin-like protein